MTVSTFINHGSAQPSPFTQGGYRLQANGKSSQVDPNLPVVSIITVVRNGSATLEETILSVIGQTHPNIEYVIIDGASTDGTINIIRKYEDRIAYWVSEQDKGIFDAMNKGIDSQSGDWVLFLGADDKLFNKDVVMSAMALANERFDLMYGDTLYSNGKHFRSSFDSRMLLHNKLQHQSVFYRRCLLTGFHYDPSLKVNADYELNLLLFLKKTTACYLNYIVAFCNHGGVSTDLKLRRYAIHELNLIRRRHVPPATNAIMSGVLNTRLALRLALSCFFT